MIFLVFWYDTRYSNSQFLFLDQLRKYHFPVTFVSYNFLTSQLKYLQHYEINNYNLHAHIFRDKVNTHTPSTLFLTEHYIC